MHGANPLTYLDPVLDELAKKWPDNRTMNIVCHGHSVPAGYFATPFVDSFHAYPHLLHRLIKERFPFAVVNVIVTAIGGENSRSGSARFKDTVLCHRPDVVTIDYSGNDRAIEVTEMETNWRRMIDEALAANAKPILLTSTLDRTVFHKDADWDALLPRVELVRALADEYNVGLADSFAALMAEIKEDTDVVNLLSHVNHPTYAAHQIVTRELGRFFLAR